MHLICFVCVCVCVCGHLFGCMLHKILATSLSCQLGVGVSQCVREFVCVCVCVCVGVCVCVCVYVCVCVRGGRVWEALKGCAVAGDRVVVWNLCVKSACSRDRKSVV